ncbi:MAG: T9SS type A sorting domain-containing protein, partial [Candidatus Edwardsbacteria bacterium]|nr:T9SS type A sorting domain-containing protein [Candidatus Edwardsbacteria bacterium]
NFKYNPANNSWQSRTAIPWPNSFAAAVDISDSLYLIGGLNATGYLSSVGAYNPFGNNWSSQTIMPQATAYHTGAAVDSLGFWIIGGKTSDGYITEAVYKAYRPGGISGTCSTTTSGALPGALVSAVSGGVVKNSEATNDAGYYVIAGLEPGVYDLRVYKPGVLDTTVKPVSVKWGRMTLMPPVWGVAGERSKPFAYTFSLSQSYPNPFRTQTMINFQIPEPTEVELSVYNVLGQRVITLVRGMRAAGRHSISWRGEDENKRRVASGIYFYRLKAGAKNAVKKIIVLR